MTTPTGILFYEPRAKPLSTIGLIQPGCYYQFYLTGTTTQANVYGDGNLTSVLSQTPGTGQTTAAADGRLIPIYLNPATTYRVQLYNALGVLLEDVDPYIPGGAPSAAQLGLLLYPQTAAEISAGVTPTNYTYQADPIADARRYGLATTNTASQNAFALGNAIAVRVAAGGGVIQCPAGNFNITDSIVIPQYVTLRGVGGTNGTTFTSSSTGNPAFYLGTSAINGSFKYGCSLTDVQIVLSNSTGKAVQLTETVSAVLRNLYITGPITAGRSTKGVVIDGGNIGSFFNLIENVECSHIHIGFDQLSTGTTAPTTQIYMNISGVGDYSVDPTSIGYRLSGSPGNTGNGTVVLGADMEQFGWSYYFTSSCGPSTNIGLRSENTPSNTSSLDLLIETGAGAQMFFGGILDIPDGKVLVNTSVKLNLTNGSGLIHKFWGIANGSNLPNASFWSATNYFVGAATGDSPVTIVAFPGDTTTPILDMQNSAGNHLFQISAQGKILRIANAAPATVTGAKGGNAALTSLVNTLASYGLIVDGTS